jgi:SAM-dependent methyltransferase
MKSSTLQMCLPGLRPGELAEDSIDRASGQVNKLQEADRVIHDWYRFVLSFPPHLVRDYLQDFGLGRGHTVLDPFCGTGTTLVEAKLNGIQAFGLESNPFPHFASSVKVNWNIDPDVLVSRAHQVADATLEQLREQGIDDDRPFGGDIGDIPLKSLKPEAMKLLIKNSISLLPLHKTLVLLDHLKEHSNETYYNHALLALGNALVLSIGNLRFGPEVGIGKLKKDVPVVSVWLSEVAKIASDLRLVAGQEYPRCYVHLADAREISQVLAPHSVDGVITSPPYPNEKDYTRTTRLETVVLGFISSRAELRAFKKTFVRSNTRGVYKEDNDDRWVAQHQEIQRIADAIEQRRTELGKTSGFERMYGRVTRLYFGGMARHLAELCKILRPGAQLGYVVGDQASYLRVMIRTGQLLADIAQVLGYELIRIDLFRTRFATATKREMREEVVVLRWPGEKGN